MNVRARIMKIFLTTLIGILILATAVFAEPTRSSCMYYDSQGFIERKDCLEVQGKERFRVAAQHLKHIQFEGKYAVIHSRDHGWMYINKKGNVIVQDVMSMDNGADYSKDGFVRYQREGKCGFADLSGSRTIRPQFDGCLPFEQGIARVCNDCRHERDGEYSGYAGGDSFCINTKGERVSCVP